MNFNQLELQRFLLETDFNPSKAGEKLNSCATPVTLSPRPPSQLLILYPFLNTQRTKVRQISKKPKVAPTLMATFTSAMP